MMPLPTCWGGLQWNCVLAPARQEMYTQFHSRLLAMHRTSDIGWGYGDFVQETVDELKQFWEEDEESRNNIEMTHK